jgi:hypothetical protein
MNTAMKEVFILLAEQVTTKMSRRSFAVAAKTETSETASKQEHATTANLFLFT